MNNEELKKILLNNLKEVEADVKKWKNIINSTSCFEKVDYFKDSNLEKELKTKINLTKTLLQILELFNK